MPDAATTKGKRQRRGFALLMVMILIVLLSVVVMAFQHDVAREISVTRNVRADLKAEYLAQMALIRGQVLLRLDEHAEYDSMNESWSQPLSWEGETWGADDIEGVENTEKPPQPQVLISDEERKFNLLTLARGNELQRQRAAEVLTRLIEIVRREDPRLEGWLDGDVRTGRSLGEDQEASTNTLIENLQRYLEERASEDGDNLEMTFNADEEPDVRSMKKQTPYEILTVGELLQVEGWTEKLLYGPVQRIRPESRTYTRRDERYEEAEAKESNRDWRDLDEEEKFERKRRLIEQQDEQATDPNPLPLINFITLYSTGRVNVNTAPREVLLALNKDLTWEVVSKIITARDQDRVDVTEAEDAGTDIPPSYEEEPLEGAEEEDNASFRPQDLASYQTFLQRLQNQEVEEDEDPEALEDFTAEVYNAMRPWLTVVSSVFAVEASATVGNVTHTIRAIYRRSGQNPAGAQQQPDNVDGQPEANPQPTPTGTDSGIPEDGLPPEPEVKLTLLLRDVTSSR